jgi:hypothetical protein
MDGDVSHGAKLYRRSGPQDGNGGYFSALQQQESTVLLASVQ